MGSIEGVIHKNSRPMLSLSIFDMKNSPFLGFFILIKQKNAKKGSEGLKNKSFRESSLIQRSELPTKRFPSLASPLSAIFFFVPKFIYSA
jgi:hypothetical protein